MNRATLIGNLTKDPESRTTQSGVSVCTFTIAVNRPFGGDKEKREVDYIPIVTWRGLADNCAKYLSKGKKVAVSGRIQARSYEANDGSTRYVTEIVADDVEFLTPKGGSASRDTSNADSGDTGLDDENLPF